MEKLRKIKKDHVLVLRVNDENNCSRYCNFQYPTKIGEWVEAPDFKQNRQCGNGLHGLMKGAQNAGYLHINNEKDLWVLIEVHKNDIIDLNGKVKFKGGYIYFIGNKAEATSILFKIYGNIGIHNLTLTGGDWSIFTGGDYSTLTGGEDSTLIGRDYSTLTGGDRSIITGGKDSTLIGGDYSTLIGGDYSTLTGGDWSTLTGEDYSTLTGGDYSTLTGGKDSTLTGGDYSTLIFRYWDKNRFRFVIGYIGENSLLPNTPYILGKDFKIVEKHN